MPVVEQVKFKFAYLNYFSVNSLLAAVLAMYCCVRLFLYFLLLNGGDLNNRNVAISGSSHVQCHARLILFSKP